MSLLSPPLQAFLAIIENKTVHGAAASIGLTQTGVTQRIRALEAELGATLFIRSRKGMHPTPEGEALLRFCQGTMDLQGIALSQIKGSGSESEVRIKITGPTSAMTSRVTPRCLAVYRQFANLVLDLEMDDSDARAGLLKMGKTQFAILPPDQVTNEMDSKRLKPDRYVIVGTARWKGRKLREIVETERVIDFYASDRTTHRFLQQIGLSDLSKRSRLFVNNNEALIRLIGAGVGFGTLTEEVAAPHLKSGDLVVLHSKAILQDPLALAWYPRPQMPKYFEAVIQAIS